MTIKAELRQAVRRGIKVLNKRRYSWPSEINTSQLDLGRCDLCVLGQLYSQDYCRGLRVLGAEVSKRPERYGFSTEYDFEELTEVWREEIAKQRALRRKQAVSA